MTSEVWFMKLKKFVIFSIGVGLFVLLVNSGRSGVAFGQRRIGRNVSGFSNAAKENSRFRYSLRWTFGRRAQRGWYLYVPLIQNAIQTGAAPNTAEFAHAIYKWQREKQIKADGILNRKTLYSLVSSWQSKRIRPIVTASDNELVFAPIHDFFDVTRDRSLLAVQKDAYAAYKKMIRAAISDENLGLMSVSGELAKSEKFLKIISSYRSPEYQASLRKREPGAGRAQLAFRSPHFTGRALDIYVGGKPVTTKDSNRAIQVNTAVYKWLVKNAEKFGFYPYFYEPWHWEYVGGR